jgi:hypothetical protein
MLTMLHPNIAMDLPKVHYQTDTDMSSVVRRYLGGEDA